MELHDTLNARVRIQIEYIETPSLKLTLAQVGRLCDLSQAECDAAVSSLVASGFLARALDGRLLRCGLGRPGEGATGSRSLAAAS
jgi:hypothetical protein